jgi:predicted nucleic acid-binding protein
VEVILDTNAVSAIGRKDPYILPVLQGHPALFVPAIVVGEYRFGILGSRKQHETTAWFNTFLQRVQVLNVTEETSERYANVCHALKEAGTPIPQNDAWIAAIALQHSLPLLTRDAHFDRIAGLRRIHW